MKRLLLFVITVLLACSTFCQQKPMKSREYEADYLKISHKQKKIALIMLGGGAVLVTLPLIVFLGTSGLSDNNLVPKYIFTLGSIAVGGLAMLGSIPLFILAAKNKGKALSGSAGFRMESLPSMINSQLINSSYPAVSFRISL